MASPTLKFHCAITPSVMVSLNNGIVITVQSRSSAETVDEPSSLSPATAFLPALQTPHLLYQTTKNHLLLIMPYSPLLLRPTQLLQRQPPLLHLLLDRYTTTYPLDRIQNPLSPYLFQLRQPNHRSLPYHRLFCAI